MSFFKTIKNKIDETINNTGNTNVGAGGNTRGTPKLQNSSARSSGGSPSVSSTNLTSYYLARQEEEEALQDDDLDLINDWNENDKYIIHIWGNAIKKDRYPIVFGREIFGEQRIVQISTGAIHLAFITNLGKLYTFGDGLLGRLGHGDQESYLQPKLVEYFVENNEKVVQIATGGKHTLALTESNRLYSWGGNDSCQLGNGSSQSFQLLPQNVELGQKLTIRRLSCSTTRSAFLTRDGLLFTWGRGDHGRLGHGDTLMQATPKQVIALYGHNVREISSGGGHSMVLTSRGEVFTWGRGENGQLGHGGFIGQQLTPKQVMSLQGKVIKLISAGGYHSIAVQNNGDVYAWGRSDYGVLGIGSLEVGDKTSPYLLETIRNLDTNPIVQISSGFQHNIAIRADKTILTWGCGAGGRLTNTTKLEENQFIPKSPTVNFTPCLVSCGEVITMIVGKNPIVAPTPEKTISTSGITLTPPPTTVSQASTVSTPESNTTPESSMFKTSVELPKSSLSTPPSAANIKRPVSPTPSFVSLAQDKLLPGKDLLLNTQTYFLEWLSGISKSKDILALIQTKVVSSIEESQLETEIEKKISQYDEYNRSIKEMLINRSKEIGNDLSKTYPEVEKILELRNQLATTLLSKEIEQSIGYWNKVLAQKEQIYKKLLAIIKNCNGNSLINNNNSSTNGFNDGDIQKQSSYLIEKLNGSMNLLLKNINMSIESNWNSESTRLSMEEIQLIIMETFKYAEKYIFVLENTLQQCQSLVSRRTGKKIEIQLHLDKYKEALDLLDQREKLKSSYRACKRNSIELSKKIEVMELDGDLSDDGGSKPSSDDSQLSQLQEKLQKLKKEEQKLIIQQQDVNANIQDILEKYVPELKVTMKQQDKISNRVKDTGLVLMERKFSNYDIVKTLATHPHNVYLASLDDQMVVLKEFGIGDQMGKQMFERQVSLMKQMNHICIMPIQAVFYDRNAFIQMEYVEGGDLVKWLKDQERKPWEIQMMFQQIIQGVAYMHSNGIIHRDLKLENVLIKENTVPIISDFDLSKDLNTIQSNATMFQGGTEYYKAPEMKEQNDKGNYSTDIWAFGVMLYKAHFPRGREPFLLPEENSLPIPSHTDQRLVSLLQSILQRNPSLRPTAHQITVHPYFVTSLVEDLLLSRTLIDSREKIAAIRAHIQSITEISEDINDACLELTVERNHLIRDVFQFFKKIEATKLFQRLEVTFKGEKGLDHGGLTSEMYSILLNNTMIRLDQDQNHNQDGINNDELKSIFSKKFNLFERSNESPFYLLQSANLDMSNDKYPLSSLQREQMVYKTLGKIFLKSVIDGRVIPDVFPPSFFKYLLNIKPNLQDLEAYDPQLAMSFKKVLILDNIEDYLSITFEGLVPDGENIPVIDSNKVDFIQKNIERVLIGCRQSQMEAFKNGFMSIESLNAHFQLFSSTELQLLMCGNTLVDSNLLKKSLKFIGFPENSQTPTFFTKVLDAMSQDELHLFLRFLTGMVALPLQGLEKPLSIVYVPKSDKLPVSHTCNYQLDLPDYNDFSQLQKKILQMIEWLDSGFSFI